MGSVRAALQTCTGQQAPTAEIQSDRQAIRRILDRVKDDSLTWKYDQAVRILGDQQDSRRRRGPLILNDVTRNAPYMFSRNCCWQNAWRRSATRAGAIDQLVVAAVLSPIPPPFRYNSPNCFC